MKTICIDYDGLLFKACCAVEERSIIVKHKTGFEKQFKNRTEFYGHHKKKSGGWLALNKEYNLEEFEIEDTRTVEPVEHALGLLKRQIESIVSNLEADKYYGYISGEGNFRKDICTLLPYKGNRKDLITPFHLDAAKEYLKKYHNAVTSNAREVDDRVCTDMYSAVKKKENFIGIVFEKDYLGCDGTWYWPDNGELKVISGFGELHREDTGVKGTGRLWKYFQCAFSDSIDNYYANCFSDQKNGEVAVYNKLKDCTNDKEAFEAMKEHFKYLYPEPKVITNWKGDTFEIDWLYVMQEMFCLAHLERWEGDRIDVRKCFNNLGIKIC